jgi:hypothetical protein
VLVSVHVVVRRTSTGVDMQPFPHQHPSASSRAIVRGMERPMRTVDLIGESGGLWSSGSENIGEDVDGRTEGGSDRKQQTSCGLADN